MHFGPSLADWDVAYSSNPSSPGGGYRSWIGRLIFKTREMVQGVNAPDVIVNAVRFSLFGVIPGEVQLRGVRLKLASFVSFITFFSLFFKVRFPQMTVLMMVP